MKVRLFTNIFDGKPEEYSFSGEVTGERLIKHFCLDKDKSVIKTPEGVLRDEDYSKPLEYHCVWIYLVPKGTVVAVIAGVIIATAVVVGVTLSVMAWLKSLTNINAPKLNSAASLRGSTNTARLNQRLPLILGRYKVTPDLASQVYSSYSENEQFIHQIFLFGYKDVVVDLDTLKIGTTPVSKYSEISYSTQTAGIYPRRAIETAISIELTGSSEPVTRTTATGTVLAVVGLSSPSGFYSYNDDGDKQSISIGVKIEYKLTEEETWTTAFNNTLYPDKNAEAWRWAYNLELPYSSDTYDIRVTRTSKKSSDAKYVDYAYWDVLTCFTRDSEGNTWPIKNEENYSLLALRVRASNQLNGYIDTLSGYATLSCRYFNGSSWVKGQTRNPASAVLYLLTDSFVNPRPVSDDIIDWDSFKEFYEFCEDEGFTCDAQFSSDATIEELCSSICQSNLATLVVKPDRISIRVDKPQTEPVQLFTPRNAKSITMTRSFEKAESILKCKFNCEDVEYAEVERTVRRNSDGTISFDTEIGADEEAVEVSLSGVTKADHVARLLAVRLKQLHVQKRTYSWECDIEGLVCLPGDVVLLSTDSFLFGLGEARVSSVSANGIEIDSEFTFTEGKAYGLKHRQADGTIIHHKIETFTVGTTSLIFLDDTSDFTVGDLVSFGYYEEESHTVQIVSISVEADKTCKIQATDYDPAVFDESFTIPPFDPGISLYPEGTEIGQGRVDIPDRPVIPEQKPSTSTVIHYGWSRSATVAPSSLVWFWRGKLMRFGNKFVGRFSEVWSPVRTSSPGEGWYEWVRFSFDGGVSFGTPQCVSGNNASNFEIVGNTQFLVTPRNPTKDQTTLNFSINRINGLQGICEWSLSLAAINDGHVTLEPNLDSCAVVIGAGCGLTAFSLIAEVSGIEHRVEISGVATTTAERMHLGIWPQGSQSYPSTTDEGALMTGDSIVYRTTNILGKAATTIMVYVKGESSGQWVDTASEGGCENPAYVSMLNEIIMDAIYDITKEAEAGRMPVEDSAGYVYFKNMNTVMNNL